MMKCAEKTPREKERGKRSRGYFISLEGGEGSGKSTLLRHLARVVHERKRPYVVTHAPGATSVGQTIRSLLLEEQEPLEVKTELFLFLADRSEQVAKVIIPALESGSIVIADRYHDSTVAYQGARGFDPLHLRRLCQFAGQDVEPDLTFYLDVSPDEGLRRSAERARLQSKQAVFDKIEREDLLFHQRVRSLFLEISEKEPHRVVCLDASQSEEAVAEKAIDILFQKLPSFFEK